MLMNEGKYGHAEEVVSLRHVHTTTNIMLKIQFQYQNRKQFLIINCHMKLIIKCFKIKLNNCIE